MSDSKFDRQIALEMEGRAMGIARYHADRLPWSSQAGTSKEEADLPPGMELLKRSLRPLAEAIEKFLTDCAEGKARRKASAYYYLIHVDPLQAAYLTARVAINGASERKAAQTVALLLASAIEDHLNIEKMAKEAPGLYRVLMDQLKKTSNARHRTGVLRHAQQKYDLKKLKWSQGERLQLGMKLLELFESSTNVIELRQQTEGKHSTPIRCEFTEEAAKWLADGHERAQLLSPIHPPMIVRPRDWTTPFTGGYLSKAIRGVRLVKTHSQGYLDDLASMEMPDVYAAVNTIQSTPWRVNRAVLDVMLKVVETGGDLAGIPRSNPKLLPPRPQGIPEEGKMSDLTLEQQERLRAWKAEAAKIHTENAKNEADKIAFAQKLFVAKRFASEPEIYFPHNLDFRGRVYPLTSFLNPQSDDTAKGLLEFARGKPLGEHGAFWLAVHLANCFGIDKVTFEERVAWVQEHEEELLDSAARPLEGKMFWSTAEKPWQALAACFEWAGYLVQGESYVSHQPIAMDGSCSGLQHYSALLRDPRGGKAVNLVPSDRPSDIYAEVVEVVLSMIEKSSDSEAKVWQGNAPDGKPKVRRAIVKQPCMTMTYSATKFGMTEQIENALRKIDKENKRLGLPPHLEGANNHKAAVYMAGIVWNAIGRVVVAARQAMDWLKDATKLAAAEGLPIRWTAPSGLPILQEYKETVGRRLDVHYGGRRLRLTVASVGKRLDKKKQASSVAPNYVHSCDSAHLMRTVNLGYANGLRDWCVIHDSFGVHACDVDMLHAVIRQSFVEQYTPNRLEEFRDELVEQLKVLAPHLVERLPPLPKMGTLDIEAVKDSQFFFA